MGYAGVFCHMAGDRTHSTPPTEIARHQLALFESISEDDRERIIHLFDALEIDIVRELCVPSGLETDSLDELATSISISAAIQGKYGVFASYRQLFESREEKRRTALTPTVDADDQLGTLIGSVVVRSEDVHRLSPIS